MRKNKSFTLDNKNNYILKGIQVILKEKVFKKKIKKQSFQPNIKSRSKDKIIHNLISDKTGNEKNSSIENKF